MSPGRRRRVMRWADSPDVPGRNKLVAFHVGAHKTGTTVLQQYLQANPRLLRRRRIRYASRSQLAAFVGWGERLVAEPQQLTDLLAEFERSAWCRTFVGSHENICGHPFVPGTPGLYPAAQPMVDALRRVLEPHRHKIVLSVRPQHELIESYYLQSVNLGGHLPFERWLRRIDFSALSWRPLVDALVDAFGREHVEVVDFGLIRTGQENYIKHVLTRMDPRIDIDVTWPHQMNPSLSDRGLQMALAANPLLSSAPDRMKLRSFLQRYYSNGTYTRPVLLGEQLTTELRDRYAGEYADLVAAAQPVSP
jgi:hypothetical protein